MTAIRKTLPILIAALVSCPPLFAADSASGTVRLDQADWRVADVIAYPDGEEIEIVFSDQAFDRAAMAEDGRIDTFDAMRHAGNTLTLNLAADGPTMCLDFMTRSGDTVSSGSSCRSGFPETVRIASRSAERIAGAMQWTEGEERIELDFDVAVAAAAAAAEAEPGQALPTDGGEPGEAVLAHFSAVVAGDWEKLKSISHPDRRAMMEQSEASGDHLELFQMLQAFAPRKVEVTGGTRRGEQAEVDYRGEEDGRAIHGVADVVLFEGRWYFVGSTTRD